MSRPTSARGGMAGEWNPHARLTESQVLEIRRLCDGRTDREVAELIGVARTTVTSIRLGRRWGHLTQKEST